MIERSIKGVDSASPATEKAAKALYEAGVRFWGRYLVPKGWKALTKVEADILHNAGIALLLIWETTANRPKGGAAAGTQDGTTARELAKAMGVPAGTTIYFAVDYNPAETEYDVIANYIRAAMEACGEYVAGVYGSYAVVESMRMRTSCNRLWQCVAWSSGHVSDNALTYQYQWQGGNEAVEMGKKAGFAVDMNACADMRQAGLWLPRTAEEYDDGDGGTIIEPKKKPWYADAMAWGEARGIINDGRPNDGVTRAEVTTMLQRFAKHYSLEDPDAEREYSGLLTDD